MLARALVSLALVLVSAAVVSAQPSDSVARAAASGGGAEAAAAPALGYGAMPGGALVASAHTLPVGQLGVAASLAYGDRKELLGGEHHLQRGIGSLALAYSPWRQLSIGVILDGRYDRHYGIKPSGDDGYVGDPRLQLRFARPLGRLALGAQATLWLPGKDAPSVAFDATSVDLRAIGSIAVGKAMLSANLGFRFDNSAKSIENPEKLSAQDQVSLGVGEFNAIIAGAMLSIPLGPVAMNLELGMDRFVGADHPDPTLRALLSAGRRLSPTTSVQAFAQLASVASPLDQIMIDGSVPLIPYDTQITVGFGFAARFGGTAAPATTYRTVDRQRDQAIEIAKIAVVAGTVLDDVGGPVVGAKITIETENKTGTAVSDGDGKYRIGELPVGPAKISVEVAGKKPRQITVTLVDGDNPLPQMQLDAVLPPGELRGNVRSRAGGRVISGATITVMPGDLRATSAADGSFAFEVAPGTYTVTTVADGYAPQVIEAVVDREGVTVKFINLDKK